MEYCNRCGRRFLIVYKSNADYLKKNVSTGVTIWKWFRRVPEKLWVERYQKFVENLNEEYKKKFKRKIKFLFNRYLVCSTHCRTEIQDKFWR